MGPSTDISDTTSLDVYATPFIPQGLLAVNEYNARNVVTPAPCTIDYEAYARSFAGTGFHRPHIDRFAIPETLVKSEDTSEELSHHTYQAQFHHYLDQECAALRALRKSQALYKVAVAATTNDGRPDMYNLVIPGIRETTFRLEVGDKVLLRQICFGQNGLIVNTHALNDQGRSIFSPGWYPTFQHEAVVSAINRRLETITLHMTHLQPATMLFNVSFTLQIARLSALYDSVAAAHRSMEPDASCWMRSMLFPEKTDGELQHHLNTVHTTWPMRDTMLNYEQIRAVDTVLAAKYGRLPYLISGPPGTGKTKTLVELAIQLLEARSDSHLLVCAPSDPAADTLVERLRHYIEPGRLLRLQSPARSFAEVPETVLPYCYIENDIFSIPPFAQFMKFRIIVTTCRDADMLLQARLSNADLFDLQHGLLTTMNPDKILTPPPLHWTALLLDEAAQAMEPEALIPLSVMAPSKPDPSGPDPLVVMVGDQNQLGPRTASNANGLQESLFERLMKREVYSTHPMSRSNNRGGIPKLTREMLPIIRPPFASLINNYRSHPAILGIPSALFYNDTLEPMAIGTDSLTAWPEWGGDHKWPILFANNPGPDEIEGDGGGWYNMTEASMAIDLAISVMASTNIAPERICIMAPFTAQVRLLRELARKSPKRALRLASLNIGPIEAFQGLESEMVIFCTTRSRDRFLAQDRSKGLGVMHEPRRLNVALTRAKSGLVVIGNPDLLVTDEHWKHFLAFCWRNGHWKGDDWKGAERAQKCAVVTRLERQVLFKEQALKRATKSLGGLSLEDRIWADGLAAGEALKEEDEMLDPLADGEGEYEHTN